MSFRILERRELCKVETRLVRGLYFKEVWLGGSYTPRDKARWADTYTKHSLVFKKVLNAPFILSCTRFRAG